jgi:hypothetical protein
LIGLLHGSILYPQPSPPHLTCTDCQWYNTTTHCQEIGNLPFPAPIEIKELLFKDVVHFVQLAFLGCLWCFAHIFIRSPSGRKRWNILGVYNAISGPLTTVANDGYITATTVCELLRKLSAQYAGLPIVIILDNARYQRCKLVQDLAEELGIKLEWLPSYSPNLNLIERLWKFTKKKCLYNVYYESFVEFVAGITDCLDRVDTEYKEELKTLMQPNFQDMKKVSLLAL